MDMTVVWIVHANEREVTVIHIYMESPFKGIIQCEWNNYIEVLQTITTERITIDWRD
jgi:hypothetical protein